MAPSSYSIRVYTMQFRENNSENNSEMGGALNKPKFNSESLERLQSIEEKIESYVGSLQEVNSEEKISVKNLLLKHKNIFPDTPGCTHVYEHVIRPTVEKPYVKKSYPVPLHQQPAVDREIKKMLEQNIIERSCSEFCNPKSNLKKEWRRTYLLGCAFFK